MAISTYQHAFQLGQIARSVNGDARIERREIGQLVCPTGRIMVFDPGCWEDSREPKDAILAPGLYPVVIAIAQFDNGDERIAAAMIQIPGTAPTNWKNAKPSAYLVENGVACFADFAAAKQWMHWNEQSPTESWNQLGECMRASYSPTRSWGTLTIERTSGLNIIAFDSGVGDGVYSSLVGEDSNGRIVCVVTDFGIVGPKE